MVSLSIEVEWTRPPDLEPQLAVDEFLVNVGLAGRAHGDLRIAHHDAEGVDIMAVQPNGIVGSDFDLVDIYVLVVEGEMVVRLGSERNDRGLLRG